MKASPWLQPVYHPAWTPAGNPVPASAPARCRTAGVIDFAFAFCTRRSGPVTSPTGAVRVQRERFQVGAEVVEDRNTGLGAEHVVRAVGVLADAGDGHR